MSKYDTNSIKQLRTRIQNTPVKKIVLGAGNSWYGVDWIATNEEELDITNEEDWEFLFGTTRADYIFAEHVWEHLNARDTQYANRNVYNYLKRHGNFRIAVPDGNFPDQAYIDHVRPGGIGAGADDHKFLYTHKTLLDRLHKVPFMVELLEYWDEKGKFHYQEWDVTGGKVSRSKRFDSRNDKDTLNYTSIIADCRK